MRNFCFLIFLLFFSCFTYSNECASQFISRVLRDVRHIQKDLTSSSKQKQLTALRHIRDIRPDNLTINKWVLPFLKSKDTPLRFSAIRIITESIDMYPQFISTLLLHLKHEKSSLIIKFINGTISDITPLDRKIFYQGKDIVDNIERLNAHFNKLNQWFTQLGLLHPSGINRWLNKVLQKNTADRSIVEQETFKLYQETTILTEALKKSLLNTPSTTYTDFTQFLKNYVKYSGRPVLILKGVDNFIRFFYSNLHKINSH